MRSVWMLLMMITCKVRGKCRIKPLSINTRIPGDTIISGTVKSFYMKESGGPYAGKVVVRRVMKGAKELEGRMVMVEGFGSRDICLSSPRLGDTKIFFLQRVRRRHGGYSSVTRFKLSDNILKMTLKNLKVLWKLEEKGKKGEKKKQRIKDYDFGTSNGRCSRSPFRRSTSNHFVGQYFCLLVGVLK